MPMDKTINGIMNFDLCTGCGTCISVCPNGSIQLILNNREGRYMPVIDNKKCINCGFCLDVCPGQTSDINLQKISFDFTDGKSQLLGPHLNCYSGHSTDHNIRFHSASGGLVTSILIHALEIGLITGVLVTRMNKNNPLEPEAFIARNKEEIIMASGSKYCPVSLNIGLNEILMSKNDEKFAVVGLPCHIEGVKNAEKKYKDLQNKIVLHVGLFCGGTPSFSATKFLLKRLHLHAGCIKSFHYRGNGWPGNMTLELNSGEKFSISYPEYWEVFGNLFYPFRCKICVDWFAKMADISVGDAWLSENKNDKIGSSLIISRNSISSNILEQMEIGQKINLYTLSAEKVLSSQIGFISRRTYLRLNLLVKNILKKQVFVNEGYILKPHPHNYIIFSCISFMSFIASKHQLWSFLNLYCYFFKFVSRMIANIKVFILNIKVLIGGKSKK